MQPAGAHTSPIAAPKTPVPAGRLPAGKHGFTRQQVTASQRQRLLEGLRAAVTEHGFAATTIADIVSYAEVSRSTFYTLFADKEACFLAAYDQALAVIDESSRRFAAKIEPDAPWHVKLAAELDGYLRALAAEPEMAVVLHQEVLMAGNKALEHRADLLALLGGRALAISDLARWQEPTLSPLPPEVLALYAGGIDELIRDRLRTAGAGGLTDLAVPLVRASVALLGS